MTTEIPLESAGLARALTGQYALDRELGRGGMGIVYLARDVRLERLVAVKVLPPHLAGDQEIRERFLREARTAGQLSHPNIVPVHRADEIDGYAFFVMGFVEGDSLGDRVRDRGTLPAPEAVRYLREVAQALAYAHARGVIHRDIKPENILIERLTNRAVVTDFGIARDIRASRLTADGLVLGTVAFMSPEQVSGDTLDGRSDLYALGVVGFYLLSGRLPFDGETAIAIVVGHATRPAPPLASVAPHVSRELASVIDRCLAKDPADRYTSGEDLAEALSKALAATPPEPREDSGVVLSEAQAATLWRRAAQLQADALQRLETRTPVASYSDSARGAPGSLATGFQLGHVRAAAVEAGISEQFVALALAELPRDSSGGIVVRDSARWQERHATQLLGSTIRSCAVTRVLRAPPRRVLQALGHVLQQHPFDLMLRETVGEHPLDGGVMVFDLPGPVNVTGQPATALSAAWMATRHQLEADHVQVTLRPLPSDPRVCEVSLVTDLRPGVRRNVNAAVGISVGAGALSGTLGGAVAAKGLALGVAATGVGGLIAIALAGASIVGYRYSYRGAVRKSERELDRALAAVEASLRSEEIFGALPTAPRRIPPPEPDGADDIVIIA